MKIVCLNYDNSVYSLNISTSDIAGVHEDTQGHPEHKTLVFEMKSGQRHRVLVESSDRFNGLSESKNTKSLLFG